MRHNPNKLPTCKKKRHKKFSVSNQQQEVKTTADMNQGSRVQPKLAVRLTLLSTRADSNHHGFMNKGIMESSSVTKESC